MKTATKVVWAIALWTILLTMGLAHEARAESFFQAEVGLGAARSTDVDGVWTQHNVKDNHERLTTPAYLAGITGSVYERGRWSLHYHLDYVYLGTQRANCSCVSDADYAAHNYGAAATGFSGSGHIQGVALTLEPSYTWRGVRLAAEAGPFFFWNTWHESVSTNPVIHVAAERGMKVGYVFGARAEYKNISLSYRYYTYLSRSTGQYPGLVKNIHTLMFTYRF